MVPINLDYVTAYYDEYGFTIYDVAGKPFYADQLVHIKLHSLPGTPWGANPIQIFRQRFGTALAEQTYQNNSYETAGVPSLVVTLDRSEIPEHIAEAIATRWTSRQGGGQRGVAVVPKSLKVDVVRGWSPQDMEFTPTCA